MANASRSISVLRPWALVAIAVSASCGPSLTQAQAAESSTANAAPRAALEEIVVTAQRREERLQDVPIAISAMGAEDLAVRGATDLTALRGSVPSLTISSFAGANASNLISIRGVAGQLIPIGAAQAAAIYLDGVYLSRPDAGFFSLDDVERIEVLRGPQGTLYGRNATAGAVNIITRNPSDTLHGGINVSYGNYDAIAARGSLSGPIAGGFSAGLSASYDKHDGYVTNIVTGNDFDDADSYTVRGKLRYDSPEGAFDATLSADTSGWDGHLYSDNVYSTAPAGGTYVGIGDPKEIQMDPLTDQLTDSEIRSDGVALTLNYAATDSLAFSSITSARKVEIDHTYDGDGTAVPFALSVASNNSDTLSQEVRASYTGARFRATIGGNYLREEGDFSFSAVAPSLPPSRPLLVSTTLDTYAMFGQVEFDLTEQLTLVGGARYNREDRDFVTDYRLQAGRMMAGNIEDSVVIPSAGINYKVTPDVLLYTKFSQGYQAPGFNFAPGIAAVSPDTFDAEELLAYEAGIKSQLWDRRVTLNAAAFYYDYKDLQVRSAVLDGSVIFTRIDNATNAVVQGAEVELAVSLTDALKVNAQVAYLDTAYEEFCQLIAGGTPRGNDPLCANPTQASREGNRLNQAPEWSGGIGIDYAITVGNLGELTAHVDYAWASNVYYSTVNTPDVSSGDWDKFGARLGFQLTNGPELYVYGRNLNDKQYHALLNAVTPTFVFGTVSEPRTYGAGARYRF
jgi:iron complex outermembrane recepter protein